MKKFLKKFGEKLFLIGIAAMFAIYMTICAEHGFQTYPWYGILFGLVSFMSMGMALLGADYLLDELQKEKQKKNK